MRIDNKWYSLKNVQEVKIGPISKYPKQIKNQRYNYYSGSICITYFPNNDVRSGSRIDFEDFPSVEELQEKLEEVFSQICTELEKQ